MEKYYSRLTVDFQVNKRVCEEIALIPTKRLRNKIAGYITVRTPTLAPAPARLLDRYLAKKKPLSGSST